MPLNNSGTISIGGSVSGQSINLQLGRNANSNSSLNETPLRTLAGKPSGQISLSDFYGKPAGKNVAMFFGGFISDGGIIGFGATNTVTRINTDGTLIGSETNAGTNRISGKSGAGINSTGLFYSGLDSNAFPVPTLLTRINSSGALMGNETNVGAGMDSLHGASAHESTAMFIGNRSPQIYQVDNVNKLLRINESGSQIGSEVFVGKGRGPYSASGARADNVMLVYGGYWYTNANTSSRTTSTNFVERYDYNGTLLSTTSSGLQREFCVGFDIDNLAFFYGGSYRATSGSSNVLSNQVQRFNSSGTSLGTETLNFIGAASGDFSGAGLKNVGILNGMDGNGMKKTIRVSGTGACLTTTGTEKTCTSITSVGTGLYGRMGTGLS